jgi:hypothetical protein
LAIEDRPSIFKEKADRNARHRGKCENNEDCTQNQVYGSLDTSLKSREAQRVHGDQRQAAKNLCVNATPDELKEARYDVDIDVISIAPLKDAQDCLVGAT